MAKDDATEYGRVKKNAADDVVIRAQTYRGERRLDVRVWVRPILSGDPTPTKAGVNLRPEQWAELLPLLTAALEAEGVEVEDE